MAMATAPAIVVPMALAMAAAAAQATPTAVAAALASLLFCCLVLFTTVWEYLTELLEHRVAGHHGYQELLEKVWKLPNYPNTRTVDNFVMRLRRHSEEDPAEPAHAAPPKTPAAPTTRLCERAPSPPPPAPPRAAPGPRDRAPPPCRALPLRAGARAQIPPGAQGRALRRRLPGVWGGGWSCWRGREGAAPSAT